MGIGHLHLTAPDSVAHHEQGWFTIRLLHWRATVCPNISNEHFTHCETRDHHKSITDAVSARLSSYEGANPGSARSRHKSVDSLRYHSVTPFHRCRVVPEYLQ